MSGSVKAGTAAERHTCKPWVQGCLFLRAPLTKTWMSTIRNLVLLSGWRAIRPQNQVRDDGRRLQVRAESQQTAIAILHYKLAGVPWHVGKSPSELYPYSRVLGIKCVGIFDEQVRVEQFLLVFVRIGCGRQGAPEVNRLLVARHDCINRRVLPRPHTLGAELVSVVGKRSWNVNGEELRCNLADHVPSLLRIPAGRSTNRQGRCLERRTGMRAHGTARLCRARRCLLMAPNSVTPASSIIVVEGSGTPVSGDVISTSSKNAWKPPLLAAVVNMPSVSV